MIKNILPNFHNTEKYVKRRYSQALETDNKVEPSLKKICKIKNTKSENDSDSLSLINNTLKSRNSEFEDFFKHFMIPCNIYKTLAIRHKTHPIILKRNLSYLFHPKSEFQRLDLQTIADNLSRVRFHDYTLTERRNRKSTSPPPLSTSWTGPHPSRIMFQFGQFQDSKSEKDWKTVETVLFLDIIHFYRDKRKAKQGFVVERIISGKKVKCNDKVVDNDVDDADRNDLKGVGTVKAAIDVESVMKSVSCYRVFKSVFHFKILAKEKKIGTTGKNFLFSIDDKKGERNDRKRDGLMKTNDVFPVTYEAMIPFYYQQSFSADSDRRTTATATSSYFVQPGKYQIFLEVTDMEKCDDSVYCGKSKPIYVIDSSTPNLVGFHADSQWYKSDHCHQKINQKNKPHITFQIDNDHEKRHSVEKEEQQQEMQEEEEERQERRKDRRGDKKEPIVVGAVGDKRKQLKSPVSTKQPLLNRKKSLTPVVERLSWKPSPLGNGVDYSITSPSLIDNNHNRGRHNSMTIETTKTNRKTVVKKEEEREENRSEEQERLKHSGNQSVEENVEEDEEGVNGTGTGCNGGVGGSGQEFIVNSDGGDIRIAYKFVVKDKIVQWTQTNNLTCPWCLLRFQWTNDLFHTLSRLMAHLNNWHSKMEFRCNKLKSRSALAQALAKNSVVSVEVKLTSPTSSSLCSQSLTSSNFPGNVSVSCVGSSGVVEDFGMVLRDQYPTRRMPLTELIYSVHQMRKVQNSRERKTARRHRNHNRDYNHTWSAEGLKEKEFDIDSEGEENMKWMFDLYYRKIEEFSDLNRMEKRVIQMWNQGLLKHGVYLSEKQLKPFVENFIQEIINDKTQLRAVKSMRNTFMLHLVNLIDFGVLPPSAMLDCMKRLDDAVL